MAAHQGQFPVRRMARVLGVSASGYYAWLRRRPSAREMANQALLRRIRQLYTRSYRTYGSPRIYHALRAQGVPCSEQRVARLMRDDGLRAVQTKRYRTTTKRNAADAVAPNRLQQDFTATAPNQKWVVDLTYIPTTEGWLYLAVVLDLYSRRVVGWSMEERMTSKLTRAALRMACTGSAKMRLSLVNHSERFPT